MVRNLDSDNEGTSRPWSPYRRVERPTAEKTTEVTTKLLVEIDDDDPEDGIASDNWDEAMKVDYLSKLKETEPAVALIAETRRFKVQS